MTFEEAGKPLRTNDREGSFMKRRQFVEQLGIGSAVLAAAGVAHAAQNEHEHRALTGPLASATVSFGGWPVGTVAVPLDRTVTPLAPVARNVHALLPQEVTIKEGGTVNFILAGFHQVVVYAPGTKPGDINTTLLLPIPGAPAAVGLINDPENRIYRGLDPRLLSPAPPASPNLLSQDRSEVVGFATRGTYLVICAVNVHFADGMFGWVRVIA
jgi:plastocyanin